MIKRTFMSGAIAVALLGTSLVAMSASDTTQPASERADDYASTMLEYSYDRMKRFAAAYMMIADVQGEYDPALRKLDPGSAQYRRLVAESDQAMLEAIESTGLTDASYNAIATTVAGDETMQRDVGELIAKLREEAATDDDASEGDSDVVDLGTMEVAGFRITKSLIDAEVELALTRQITTDRDADFELICRDSRTGTNIKRRWCAYNRDLALPKRSNQMLVIDPRDLQWRWERFYERLPD